MSFRAVILGLLAGALIAGVGYLNDQVLRLNFLVGNHFPISVFGLLILYVLTINPLLALGRRDWRLRPAELATATALMLVACSVPGSSLMRVFTPTLVMPIQHNRLNAGWRRNAVLSYVPSRMLPGGGRYDPEVVDAFIGGKAGAGKSIGLADVPWDKWRRPLTTWLPLIFLAGLSAICMSLIVHYQWSRREKLRYPVADFAATVMSSQPGCAYGAIFTRKLFWAGLAVALGLHLINGTHAWYPGFIRIPLEFEIPLWQKYPGITEIPTAGRLLRPLFFPTFVAFAYFLASDISFSLGICQVLFVLVAALLMKVGVDISQSHFGGGPLMWERFGSYLVFALLLAYSGRRYYGQVFRRALLIGTADRVETSAVWAARALILAALVMVAILASLCLAWPLAVLTVGMLLLMYLVLARINAEAGLFHCEPLWEPMAVMVGMFGYYAVGLQGLAIIGLFTAVLAIDPRECLMPFVVNGLKMCDQTGGKPGGTGWLGVGALLIALAVAVPVVLWANYNYGVKGADQWSTQDVPNDLFNTVNRAASELRLSGRLDESVKLSAYERLTAISPDGRFLWALGIGGAGVLALSALRRRLPWWPLHPVIFLVAGTWTIEQYSHSFLLGWLVKTAVTKLGGPEKYRHGKDFMFGIVAGDLLGGLAFMAIGALYYRLTGLLPAAKYFVFPN